MYLTLPLLLASTTTTASGTVCDHRLGPLLEQTSYNEWHSIIGRLCHAELKKLCKQNENKLPGMMKNKAAMRMIMTIQTQLLPTHLTMPVLLMLNFSLVPINPKKYYFF